MRKQIIGVTCVFCVLVGLVFAEDKKSKDTVKEGEVYTRFRHQGS